MIKRLFKSYSNKFLSRWLVFVIDLSCVVLSFLATYLIIFTLNAVEIEFHEFKVEVIVVGIVYTLFFLITKSYFGIIRHTALYDAFRLIKATSFSFLFLMLSNILIQKLWRQDLFHISYSILIIHFFLSSFFLVGFRVIVKLLFISIGRTFIGEKIAVLIYGAGAAGMLTKYALIKDVNIRYEVVAYIDDNTKKINKSLEGIPVITQDEALKQNYIKQHHIKQVIISIQNLESNKKKLVVEKGISLQLKVKVVPAVDEWINGSLSSQQLRNVNIEELLGRDTIDLDNKNIDRELRNKTILITGGAGSIGSEIARQVMYYSPKRLIILDQAETPIYDLKYEFNNTKAYEQQINRIEFIIANVKDKFRMNNIFEIYHPDIIYHAAAYKHVPLMEQNPYEAIMVNIFGTKNIAELSLKHEAEKFVMISTDKAVNPTNIMGASKRMAEICIQKLSNTTTKFVTTRFGNVLGSNGSVVPLFRKQIESGGPITLTHKDINRYFMTISEACNLVMEAGAMGKGSDIFVFDMGEPVKIYDLAKKMIHLYGFTENEIQINEIGLRPGEKLYEELLNNKENTLPTHHPKIMRARISSPSNGDVYRFIESLSELIIEGDDFALVAKMKEIVPEFISNNSIFEKLDKKRRN